MNAVMAFLHKYIGGFFRWWNGLNRLPTTMVGKVPVKWSYVLFAVLFWLAMWLLLPRLDAWLH